MANPMSTSLAEGQSTNRPLLFSGTNFPYWKARIKIYIQAIDYHLWKVILKGPQISSIKIDGIDIPKPEEDWDDNDMRMGKLNAKEINVLYCTLNSIEFNRIFTYSTAKKNLEQIRSYTWENFTSEVLKNKSTFV